MEVNIFAIPVILGIVLGIFLYKNGKRNTIYTGKIINKAYSSITDKYYFTIKAIDQIDTVKVSKEHFEKFKINDKYSYKLWKI